MKLKIEQERKQRGWTGTFIAEHIGLTKSAVSKMLNGKIKPSYDVLVKLENLFEMGHKELFTEEE